MENSKSKAVREQKLRYYDEEKNKEWVDATLSLDGNGILTVTEASKSPRKIELSPFVNIGPPKKGVYDGVFVIHTKAESNYSTGPRFACKDTKDTERWIQLLSFVALKKKVNLRHKHPLTPSNETHECIACKEKGLAEEDELRSDDKGESEIRSWVCEFCENYHQCVTCYKRLSGGNPLIKSPSHAHQLLRLDSASGFWVEAGYKGRYECDTCGTASSSVVYHCVECGDYDECPTCALKGNPSNSPNAASTPGLTLDLEHLSHVVTCKDQKYSLNVDLGKRCPANMSVKTNQFWDLRSIEAQPATHAYMEVTFDDFEPNSLVGVGIGNQIFVQNEMLGYQQNSFGVFSNGTASVNSKSSSTIFFNMKFGPRDTIGVGILFDSYNQIKAYFTKNGQYVGYINDAVHKGMDCFPGVSFTKESRAKFAVNFTGPFKYDLKSLPNYRGQARNYLEAVPTDILEIVAGYAATSEMQVQEVRAVSKTFAAAFLLNRVWRALYLAEYPTQNGNLKIKSWHKFYKRRADIPSYNISIENCGFEFECPLTWESLPTNSQSKFERHCNRCNKTVYKVNDLRSLRAFTEMGRCTVYKDPQGDYDEKKFAGGRMMGKRARPKNFARITLGGPI